MTSGKRWPKSFTVGNTAGWFHSQVNNSYGFNETIEVIEI